MATSSPMLQRAVEDAADGQAAQVIAVVEVGHQQLQHGVGIALRRRDVLHDGFEQRLSGLSDSSSGLYLAMPSRALV